MAEENQTFDDIIDSIEIADEEIIDPDEEVVETTPEDDDAEVEEQSEGPTTTDDEVVDPYARFSETGNVNDLPPGATKDKMLAEQQRTESMVRAANEKWQEAAGLRKQQEQQKPPTEEPVIDFAGTQQEIEAQYAKHQAWQRETMQTEFDTKLSQTQQQVNQILVQQQTNDLTNYASTLEGMTPEMDVAMEAVVKADPTWGEFLTSKAGIKKLFDYTKAKHDVATKQDATARQARKVAKASEPKAPSQKAEAPSVNEEIKGMGDWDALDHITQSVVYDT